ncbi:MAG: hypothetical protein ACK55Z_18045, partial [bacterium]
YEIVIVILSLTSFTFLCRLADASELHVDWDGVITVGAADGCQVTCVTWCSGAVFVTGVCMCHMVLLPQVCLCITGVCVSQASFHAVFVTGLPVSLFVARMRACAEARLGAVGRGSRHALC